MGKHNPNEGQMVCFSIKQSPNKRIIYYYHGFWKKGGMAYVLHSDPMDIHSDKHFNFITDWTGDKNVIRDNFNELSFDDFTDLIGEQAYLLYIPGDSKKHVLSEIRVIRPISEDAKYRVYIKKDCGISKQCSPIALDPPLKVSNQIKRNKSFLNKLKGKTK